MSQLQTKLSELMNTLQLQDVPAGGSVVVYHKGQLIAQASVGKATPHTLWDSHTLSLNFSTGKGVLVTLIHILVSEGLLAYDKPIAHYWQAFAVNGKESITLKDVLVHQSGLFNIQSIIDNSDEILDWDVMLSKVQNMTPEQPINDKAESCYSALVSGWVLGGLIEIVTKMPLNAALDNYLAQPLGIDGEIYFGVPQDKLTDIATLTKNFADYEDNIRLANCNDSNLEDSNSSKTQSRKFQSNKPRLRVDNQSTLKAYKSLPSYGCWQTLVSTNLSTAKKRKAEDDKALSTLDIASLYFDISTINLKDFKHALMPTGRLSGIGFDYYAPQSLLAKIPAANGVATAQALAKMYAMLANKGKWQDKTFINAEVFGGLSKVYVEGSDAIMAAAKPQSMQWRLGYHRIFSRCQQSLDIANAFGHMGYNGSVAWCDTDRELAVAFVHNYDVTMSTDIRQFAIIEAILQWL